LAHGGEDKFMQENRELIYFLYQYIAFPALLFLMALSLLSTLVALISQGSTSLKARKTAIEFGIYAFLLLIVIAIFWFSFQDFSL
jgi:ABC-type Na+ efflux pump permease subunit